MSHHAYNTHRWGRHVGMDVTLVTPIVATVALLNSSGSHQTPETIIKGGSLDPSVPDGGRTSKL
jgi:hypothetical protein